VPKGLYRAAGYRVCGERAVRVDILERLADLIRPAIAYRPGLTQGTPPTGAADQDGFVATGAMTSLVGCAGEDFASILRSLGYVSVKRPGPAITVPLAQPPEPKVEPLKAGPAADPVETVAMLNAGADAADGVAEPAASEAGAEAQTPVEAQTPAEAGDATSDLIEAAAPETPDTPILTQSEIAAEAATEVVAEPESAPEPVREPVPADMMSALPGTDSPAADLAPEVAEDVAARPVVEAKAPAEPELIEVWRPHRHQGGRRPEHAGRGPREAAPAGERQPGGRRGDRPNREGRPDDRRRDGGQNRPAVAAEPGGPEAAPAATPRPERAPRRDEQPRQGQPPRGGRPEQGRGPRPDFKRDGRPGGGPRRDERGGGGERFQQPPRPRPAEREPDPDSPFAKLAALKAQLEGRKT
jgi:ATP-dependent RNA helicase SUPV3L1/SUV3